MPHSTLKLIAGVDQNRTLALNEAAISFTNLVRFIPDRQNIALVQKLGGWVKYFNTSLPSVPRALWAWEDTNAVTYLAIGSEGDNINKNALSVISNGSRTAISPTASEGFKGLFAVSRTDTTPFKYNVLSATTSGTTATVIFDNYHYFDVGSYIYISGNSVAAYNGVHYVTNTPSYDRVEFEVASGTASGSGGTISYGNGFQTTAGSPNVVFNYQGSSLNNYSSVFIETPVSIGGLVLYGMYPVKYISPNSVQIVAKDALGNPQAASSTVSSYPGAGNMPAYYFVVNQSTVYVYLPNHGYSIGDIYPVPYMVSAGTVRIDGNYTVVGLGTASGSDTQNFFSIATNNTAYKTTPIEITGDGTYASVTISPDYKFNTGDNIVIENCPISGFNTSGSIVLRSLIVGANQVVIYGNPTVATTTSLSSCTVFNKIALESNGLLRLTTFISPAPLPTSTGYGVAGYGEGGYGNGVSAPFYNPGASITSYDWTLDNWGSILVGCNVGFFIYLWDPNSGSTNASVLPEAPTRNDGAFVAMPQRQIVAWGSTFTGIQDPLLIRWCDVNDYTSWIALPTNQAGSYRLPRGSRIVGCIQGPQQGLVWTDLAVWAMQYVGLPYVYQFNEIGTGCGLIARKAAGSMNGIVYWMSQSQFYELGPTGVQIIQCPVWDVIFQDLDTDNLDKIRIAPNSRFSEITWYYPTKSNGGEINAYVKYNVALKQWDFGTLSRTAWINQSVLGAPIGAGIDDQGSYYLYQHEIGQDADGRPMNSSFQTGYFAISDGEWKVFIDQVWPDMKWGLYNGNVNAHVLLTFYVTDYPGDTPRQYGPYNLSIGTEFISPRFRGRLVSIKIESDPSETGTFWRLGAMRYRFEQDGKF